MHSRSQFIADTGHTARLVSFSSFRLSNRSFGNPLRRSTIKNDQNRSGTQGSQTRSYSNIHQLAVDTTSTRTMDNSNGLIRSTSYLQNSRSHTPLTSDELHSSTTAILYAENSNRSSPTNNSNVIIRHCRSASPNIEIGSLSPVTPTNLSFSISNFNSSWIYLNQLSQVLKWVI